MRIESNDQKIIAKKILPLFDKMLLERLQSKDQVTIAILSDHLADIIAKSSQNNTEALSHSLQNILAVAIKREIASNKDAMIDSLYPIMGGMISKYVTSAIRELMENINRKVDEGLSFDRIKRKIKSKMTGVSETELLLEESGDVLISSLFVIHKKSGLLISEAHLTEKAISDPHLVASMASAIKDFINDWIQSDQRHDEIQLLSYGNATLYIESAGSVYMIAFMDAEPDREQRMEINRFFASLVKEYMDIFQDFNGDDSSGEIHSLSQKLQHYLDKQENISDRSGKRIQSKTGQYLLVLLLLIFLIPAFYWSKDRYEEYHIRSEIMQKTGYPIQIEIKDQTLFAKGSVDTFRALHDIDKIIRKNSKGKIVNDITIPMVQVEKLYEEQKIYIERNVSALSGYIKILDHELKSADKSIVKLTEKLKEQVLQNKKIINELTAKSDRLLKMSKKEKQISRLLNLKKNIDKHLAAAFADSIYYNPKKNVLVFSGPQFFPKGSVALQGNAKKILEETSIKYFSVLLSIPEAKKYIDRISVSAYTDSDGTLQYNTQLSFKRAQVVTESLASLQYLKGKGLLKYLKFKGYAGRDVIMVNGIEDKNASRRVEIGYGLDERRISDDLVRLTEQN
ncbi:OmpA family protein [Sulfurovum sp. NBC37-1]|uniref:OmpA family protein n=1 Tax=Sulfurovum sp. (strain NBC37-1) TaxID=387093 RepID=UPI000158751B|nr:OmpA family protein [Sulfurovum sp. NBC37-1]BAF71794.1 hypothetical protein SUN_0836 [Sulfurovum sp. NBC37-1]